MKTELLEFSIVVAAEDHNPTILNPDFLNLNKIVPEKWDWKVSEPPISTPPFAMVSYENGVTVIVDPKKIQVVDKSDKEDVYSSKIKDIVQEYVQVLPHVRYTAVGINFRSFAEHLEADIFLKEHFLKSGPWDNKVDPIQGVSLKFTYPLDGGKLALLLESGGIIESSNGQSKKRGIFAFANFHRDCQGYPSDKQVIEILMHVEKDWDRFYTTLSKVLGDK